ncbi:type II toxin-antitoxin system RelE/ParE family toxin [Parapusillimonas sp. SGNA-6]|nr:type II toxin-antitoxin system RelE/ParE family toxin [Parapusillimonas sp. SGNA-6]
MELLWTLEAVRDREAIYGYIEEDNPLAALSLDDLISERTATLQDYPRMGRAGRVSGTFELVVHSSYMVVYEIVETQVRILNIVHTARQWPKPVFAEQ